MVILPLTFPSSIYTFLVQCTASAFVIIQKTVSFHPSHCVFLLIIFSCIVSLKFPCPILFLRVPFKVDNKLKTSIFVWFVLLQWVHFLFSILVNLLHPSILLQFVPCWYLPEKFATSTGWSICISLYFSMRTTIAHALLIVGNGSSNNIWLL